MPSETSTIPHSSPESDPLPLHQRVASLIVILVPDSPAAADLPIAAYGATWSIASPRAVRAVRLSLSTSPLKHQPVSAGLALLLRFM